MNRGKRSGYSLSYNEIPVVLGMAGRGDRNHDIAAWFGVNQGRIAEAKQGKWGLPAAASAGCLPPSGAPGIKGRRLRDAMEKVIGILSNSKYSDADAQAAALELAIKANTKYDKNEG